jgi:hypothetical protein
MEKVTVKLVLASVGFLLTFIWLVSGASNSKGQASSGQFGSKKVPVVVELFTSEGCSSCPPADALLAKLFNDQPVDGAEVIAIEEHVDYWNSLGWKDPFSSGKWTLRQQDYAEVFRSGSVYTPQMVIDGQAEIVGSREWESEKEISEWSRHPKTQVVLSSNGAGADGSPQYCVHLGKLTGGKNGDTAEVWLAVAEDNLQSSVARGENAGEHLRHTSVLRTLQKIGVADANKEESFNGTVGVRLDPAWKRESTRVIVMVQEHKSRRILGAAKAELAH